MIYVVKFVVSLILFLFIYYVFDVTNIPHYIMAIVKQQ